MAKVTVTDDFKLDQSDINDLAFSWRQMVDEFQYLSSINAMHLLCSVVHIYLRGRGIRMGNAQGFDRHIDKSAIVTAMIAQEAFKRYEELEWLLDTPPFESFKAHQSLSI